jgi:hypothetical protein
VIVDAKAGQQVHDAMAHVFELAPRPTIIRPKS